MSSERDIDFERERNYRCQKCEHIFSVDWAFLDRWAQGVEDCPNCGTPSSDEAAAKPWVYADEPALDDQYLKDVAWYHTSTFSKWPAIDVDPLSTLPEITIRMMGGQSKAQAWAKRQRNKALHLGTFEAAVHNMFRRISDQGDEGKNFYIYRVLITPDAFIRSGWQLEQSNFVGDVSRDVICPRPFTVARYLNEREDPGSISLAIRPEAVLSTQSVSLDELRINEHRLAQLEERLTHASHLPDLPQRSVNGFKVHEDTSALHTEARKITDELAVDLPTPLRDRLRRATAIDDIGISSWARWLIAVCAVATNPSGVLDQLDEQPIQAI